jgi:hypothetical protein
MNTGKNIKVRARKKPRQMQPGEVTARKPDVFIKLI